MRLPCFTRDVRQLIYNYIGTLPKSCISLVPGCYKITTVFSHAQTVVLCVGCSTVLCQPTGGRARLTEGEHQRPVLKTTRVARFFLVHETKTGRNIPNEHKLYQIIIIYPKCQ
jgi:ribosomal protein S27E